jgi:metallo-beta-lactamase family protein
LAWHGKTTALYIFNGNTQIKRIDYLYQNIRMNITFAGAADTVTGSKYLIEAAGCRLLLDCGLFQGFKTLRQRNWAALEFDPKSLNTVVLSHAHLDHCGFLPVLVKRGFKGDVICSQATAHLAQIMLLDSAHLLEEEAKHANKYSYSKHAVAQPLYTVDDVKRSLKLLKPVPFHTAIQIKPRLSITLIPAGHLLGACSVTVKDRNMQLVFSGDLGRDQDMLMPPPAPIHTADVLLVESTYGNRTHPQENIMGRLGDIIRTAVGHGGTVLLPSFAVGRAQALMLAIARLKAEKAIPNVPVFLDSPMAIKATAVYQRHAKLLRIQAAEVSQLCEAAQCVNTPEESRRLSAGRTPSIIIAGSGMATGGRILHHLKAFAPHPRNHIIFPGFQVPGTRGAKMVAGEPAIKIHGEYVAIKAQVSHIEGFSGHADAQELMQWLLQFHAAPQQTFVVHGERDASDALRLRIQDTLGWNVQAVEHMQRVQL